MKSVQELLDELAASGTLEPQKRNGAVDYYIPYMMNDAVEYYIHLQRCHMTGAPSDDTMKATKAIAEFSENGQIKGIIFYQEQNVYTIWCESAKVVCQCYQYHRIGHFWKRGEDLWRRLNYIIGTIYDKYSYIGPSVCNRNEQELMTILGFAPLRAFSPIDEAFDIFYSQEELLSLGLSGINQMIRLAEAAECEKYMRRLLRYRTQFLEWITKSATKKPWRMRMEEKYLHKALLQVEQYPMYVLLERWIEEASAQYPVRDYGGKQNARIEEKRMRAEKHLQQLGYHGQYPYFTKEDLNLVIYEEQPYTIAELEYEQFQFSIFYVESDCFQKSIERYAKWSKEGILWNIGFFRGGGSFGEILKTDIR